MRTSLLLVAASVVSAGTIIPRLSPNLPSSAFPSFHTVPLAQFIAGPEASNTSSVDNGAKNLPAAQTEAAATCSSNPNVRFEWNDFSDSDRLAFIASIKCLLNAPPSGSFSPATNRYEDLARLHQQMMTTVHNNNLFLLWHRYFVWTFEQLLRDECGFDRAFPWWDETLNAGDFDTLDMFTSPDYFGHLTAPVNNEPVCITSGAFGGLTCNIGPGSSNTPHCLSRAGNGADTAECNTAYINQCNSMSTYAQMEPCLEDGPHGYGHNGIGGVMADVSGSPSDPIFWMHHTFVDHSFRLWQNLDSGPRTTTIDGTDHNGVALTMDYTITVGGIRPDVTIGDILDTLGGASINGVPFCYRYNY